MTAELMPDDREHLIAQYDDGHRVVVAALAGASDVELDRRPSDDEWSAREIVHHLADSEMTSAIRLRRLLSEESPVIAGYDEAEFARRLRYRSRPIEPSLDALAAARRTTSDILRRLEPADWDRAGTHSESGAYSVDDWLRIYASHAHDHADQIRRALA